MDGRIPTLRRRLLAIALGGLIAAFLVPAAQASNGIVDDWFRDANAAPAQATALPGDLLGDYMFRDYFRNANRVARQSPITVVRDAGDATGARLTLGARQVAVVRDAGDATAASLAQHKVR